MKQVCGQDNANRKIICCIMDYTIYNYYDFKSMTNNHVRKKRS